MVVASGCVFAVSTGFPVVASMLAGPAPRWLGILDVGVAGVLVATGIAIAAKAPSGLSRTAIERSFRVYRGSATLFLVLLAVFLLVGDGIKWSILLPGLAWRAWLAAWVLPAALTLWDGPGS